MLEKNKKILIRAISPPRVAVDFDGPGLLSKRFASPNSWVYQKKPWDLSFKATTFQAIVYKFCFQGTVEYTAEFIGVTKNITIKNSHLNVTYPNTILSDDKSTLCSLLITRRSVNVKVTIEYILYNGIEDNTLCNFAGLAAYNIMNDGPYKHKATVCEPHNDFYKYRPIYSKSSKIILVMYWYNENTRNFNISVNVSETPCAKVAINVCLKYDCINNKPLSENMKQGVEGLIKKIYFDHKRYLTVEVFVDKETYAIFQFVSS